jgi:hypothetical protein
MQLPKNNFRFIFVFTWVLMAISGLIQTARSEVLPGCGDQSLLASVRSLIISNNKLSDNAAVQFSDLKTLRYVPAPYFKRGTQQAELACSAIVGVVPEGSADGKPVDAVEGFYGLTVKGQDSYQVYFQPNRPKK